MLKTLLANHTKNAASQLQRMKLDDTSYFDEEIEITEGSGIQKINLIANTRYSLVAKGFFLIGAKGVKVAYVKDDSTLSEQTSDVLGAISVLDDKKELTTRTYQIVATETQKIQIIVDILVSRTTKETDSPIPINKEEKYYLLIKKDFEGKLSTYTKIKDDEATMKSTSLIFYNPYGTTISAENGEDTVTFYNGDTQLTSPVSGQIFDTIYTENTKEPKDDKSIEEGEWSSSATITVKGNDGTVLPEKLFELTEDTIYTTSTPDATITDYSNLVSDDKLSAGAIAGIVVGCVVVVGGVSGFCVYWFIFRKRAISAPAP